MKLSCLRRKDKNIHFFPFENEEAAINHETKRKLKLDLKIYLNYFFFINKEMDKI